MGNRMSIDDNQREEAVIKLLRRTSAVATVHNENKPKKRTLLTHLIGTKDLLSASGHSKAVALGGLLHSVYGTSIFKKKTLDGDSSRDRRRVREVAGQYSERLAWLFCKCNRPWTLNYKLEHGVGEGSDNDCVLLKAREGKALKATRAEFLDLCAIEAANLLEQNGAERNFEKKWSAIVKTPRYEALVAASEARFSVKELTNM